MKNLRNKNQPAPTDTIQYYLSSSWDKVLAVYAKLADIEVVSDAIAAGDLDGILQETDLDTLAELNALIADATFGDFASQAQAEAGADNTTTMTPLRVAQAIAVLAADIQNNFTAIVDPVGTDDTNAGYVAGSVWINTAAIPPESWRCADPSAGAAVWVKTTLTVDELAAVATSGDSDDLTEGVAKLLLTVGERSKLGAIEASATADQTDTEIETAYNNRVAAVLQAEAEAGTSTTVRRWTPERVKQAIDALGNPGTGDLLADGTIPLTSNWDVGAFTITGTQFISDIITGTAPLVVASSTVVTNLNASLLEGNAASAFATSTQGSTADTALQNVVSDTTPQLGGSLDINGQKIVSVTDGNIDIEPHGTGNILLGNFTLDADQTVGVGQDNYVFTYDNASGLISLEAATGGGDVATDVIWDAAGDLAVGSGANTAAKLTMGTALQVLRVNAGATALEYATAAGGGIAWSTSAISQAVVKNTGTMFRGLSATVTATLPTTPAVGDSLMLSNNDNTPGGPYNIQVDASGTNEIHEKNVTAIPIATILPGSTAILLCYDAGATKKWQMVRMSNEAASGGGLVVEFKTASFTAVAGKKYKVDSTAAPVVVTLPAGNNLDNIVIQDVGSFASTNNITINPNGAETIKGTTTFVIDQNEGDVDIGYNNGTTDWEVSADGSPNVVNLVDYIETGTFTPTVQDTSLSDAESQTYSGQSARYVKIGPLVNFWIDITVTSLGSLTTTAQTYIAGLPFLPNGIASVNVGYAASISITADESLSGVIGFDLSQPIVRVYKWGLATGTEWLQLSGLTASGRLLISGQYTTDD